MSPLVSRLARKGLQRGLVEGSRGWLYVGMTAAAVGIARWLITEPPETVFVSEIKPGQAIEIRTVRRDGERERKGTRR
jgi:hypothetical protein